MRDMADSSADPGLILRNAIEMEIQGKEFYERAAQKMRNKRGKDMFLSLVKQERIHVDILEDELNRFVHDKSWSTLREAMGQATSPSATKISVFQDKTIKRIEIGPDAGELEVIKLGMAVEKKSIEYYHDAGGKIQDKNAKDIFNWLVAQETGHLTILQAEFDYRTKSGFYMGDPEFSLEVM